MRVKAQASAVSVLCSAAVVATAAPPVPTAHSTVIRGAEYRYALTAATIDAAFNPIQYLGNLGGAAQNVASDVIYWQTPDFPLLILSAQIDPGTGEYTAVRKVSSTATDLQNLVSAVTAFPGASSSTQVKQLTSGIGTAGAAAAGATHTITATLAPHLAPLTPVIYVVKVLSAAVGVYYAVATLSTTGVSTVLSGHNPLTAVANVVSSVQGLANAIASAPHPVASPSTASAADSTPAPSQLAAKTTATAASTGEKASTATPRTRASRGATGVKSPDAQPLSPTDAAEGTKEQRTADSATSPKSSSTPTKSKTASAPKSAAVSDSHTEPSAGATKQPAGGGSSHAESAPKSTGDH
ncbi:hypothetical protein [Mycolicibacterium sp. CBMA 226]|uniref:hypothetical protein n=1 Tax=Mycolicibacterium sp. CBMA 226 TaxID=2606611 RepID=UPI0012DD2B48|nr:hypothetical protein [Mycolicibacterium sp. CBMA 226]MUL78548.1 hypothetical protein [Mycolicibacterium sp. CBMA 226]